MQSIDKLKDIGPIITDLANQLHISENDVVRQAVYYFAEKIKKKKRLMTFAGTLDNDEADNMLDFIYKSRLNIQFNEYSI